MYNIGSIISSMNVMVVGKTHLSCHTNKMINIEFFEPKTKIKKKIKTELVHFNTQVSNTAIQCKLKILSHP